MKFKFSTVLIACILATVFMITSFASLAKQNIIIDSSYGAYISTEKEITKDYTLDLGFAFHIDEKTGYLYKFDINTKTDYSCHR